MTAADWVQIEAAVDATIDDLDAVIEHVNSAIRERVPEYAYVPDELLTRATTHNVGSMLRALKERRELTPPELDGFAITVEERARNGVPLDEYLLAVATAEAAMWEQVWLRAKAVPEARVTEALLLRFANVNAITRVTASSHRRIELATAREDQERRALALRALLRGGLSTVDTAEHLARLGLSPDRSYFIVRARSRKGLDSDRLPQALVHG
ncbi:MAG: hypothetical protein JWM40_1749, partial [Frankiales bacterium]|nr:hypothetical protein [Frankiales bacterium]